MATEGGRSVAVHRGDSNERRVTHGRGGEVAQCIVVRALPLHSAEPERLRGQAAREAVGRRAPGSAQLLVLADVEPTLTSAG